MSRTQMRPTDVLQEWKRCESVREWSWSIVLQNESMMTEAQVHRQEQETQEERLKFNKGKTWQLRPMLWIDKELLHQGKPSDCSEGRRPTCSDYGIAWHFSFQCNGLSFCHACDNWDSLPPDRSRNVLRVSARFTCTAHHESFSHPTTLCKDFC